MGGVLNALKEKLLGIWQGRSRREPIKSALPAFDFKFRFSLPGTYFFLFLKWQRAALATVVGFCNIFQ